MVYLESEHVCLLGTLCALMTGSGITALRATLVIENINDDRSHCIDGLSLKVGRPHSSEILALVISEWVTVFLFVCACGCMLAFLEKEHKVNAFAQSVIAFVTLWRSAILAIVCHIFFYVLTLRASRSKCAFRNAFQWSLAALIFHVASYLLLIYGARRSWSVYRRKKLNKRLRALQYTNEARSSYVSNPTTYSVPDPTPAPTTVVYRQSTPRATTQASTRDSPFGWAKDSNKQWIIRQLNSTSPTGATKLRDAILAALTMTRGIKDFVEKETSMEFTYVNVVLTDGEDTGSNTSIEDLAVALYVLDRLLGKATTTFLVGVGQTNSNFAELRALADLLDTVYFMHISSNDCSEIFQRIQLQLGIRREIAGVITENAAVIAKRDQLVLGVGVRRFVVLFTIDKSGSMSGTRWRSTCSGISGFLQNLTEYDLFGVQLFNHTVSWINM